MADEVISRRTNAGNFPVGIHTIYFLGESGGKNAAVILLLAAIVNRLLLVPNSSPDLSGCRCGSIQSVAE